MKTEFKEYVKNGKKHCYDTIREKYVQKNPEETVRQSIVDYILNELSVPKHMIRVEEHLSHYGVKSNDRADIIIDFYNEEDNLEYPLAVIECKAPNVYLGEKQHMQLKKYADDLGCLYAMLTDGEYYFCYYYNTEIEDYIRIESLPDYISMLKNDFVEYDLGEIPKRLSLDEIEKHGAEYYVGYDIGKDTNENLINPLVNFFECVLDVEYQPKFREYKNFTLIDDLGVRNISCGNHGGGSFAGAYRSFLVEYDGERKIVSLNISAYCTHSRPDYVRTVINVAVDTKNGAHHALQLTADENVVIRGNTLKFYHHGRIAVGNIGSGKIDELRFFVNKECPELIHNKQFYLGELTYNRLWTLDDEDVFGLIENLIAYSLIRDKYRNYKKALTIA